MSHRPIIDAGPGLNFFSVNKQNLLIKVLGRLSTPECVRDEICRKAGQDKRFAGAATVLGKLPPTLFEVLSDDPTPELESVVTRITGLPMAQRKRSPKDLGELMVVAHAVVAAEQGAEVAILTDDGDGAKLATSEIHRLGRLRSQGREVGSVRLVSTVIVLEKAVSKSLLANRGEMRALYQRMRELDDGLVPIEKTRLLANELWSGPRTG